MTDLLKLNDTQKEEIKAYLKQVYTDNELSNYLDENFITNIDSQNQDHQLLGQCFEVAVAKFSLSLSNINLLTSDDKQEVLNYCKNEPGVRPDFLIELKKSNQKAFIEATICAKDKKTGKDKNFFIEKFDTCIELLLNLALKEPAKTISSLCSNLKMPYSDRLIFEKWWLAAYHCLIYQQLNSVESALVRLLNKFILVPAFTSDSSFLLTIIEEKIKSKLKPESFDSPLSNSYENLISLLNKKNIGYIIAINTAVFRDSWFDGPICITPNILTTKLDDLFKRHQYLSGVLISYSSTTLLPLSCNISSENCELENYFHYLENPHATNRISDKILLKQSSKK